MTIDKAHLKILAQAVADLEDIPDRAGEHSEAVAYLETHMHCHTILGLLAEIERLDRESQNLSNQLGQCARDRRAFRAERDQLKAESEALRKDAERYRWLRDKAHTADWEFIGGQTPDAGEAEIDAAMAKEASQ